VPKFLSDEWQEQAKAIREEYAGEGAAVPHKMKMNLVVTGAPDDVSTEDILAHMDSSDGEMRLDNGHLDDPELTVTLDYDTAKAILVDQNPQAGMQAFMAGKIKVTGDMTKMMAMQSAAPDPNQQAIAEKIKAITD
jgi:putative sterol carrier protein